MAKIIDEILLIGENMMGGESGLMANYYMWIVSYCCAILILVTGSICLIVERKKKRKTAITVGTFLLSIFFLQLPIHFVVKDYSLFESVLGSFLASMDMAKGKEYVPVLIDSAPNFSMVYSYTLLIMQILVFGATAGVILSLFKTPIQVLRAYCLRRKDIYIFSEFNKKTCSIAESLKGKKEAKIIFTDCGNLNLRDIDKINRINGIYLNGEFASISKRMARKCKRRSLYLFVFSESESENIYKLSVLRKIFEDINTEVHIRIYVELMDTAWDEQDVINLQNRFCDNIIVNYVRVADNFAINNLYNNSIFDNAINVNGNYNIKVLIVGADEYSYAMIKHILALGQMPRYFVKVHVIDNGNGYDVLRKQFPELCEYVNEDGNAKYAFSYYENIDPNTYSFEQLIEKECSDFTFCFVSMGDNVQNHAVVSSLNRIRYRCGNTEECIIQVRDIQKSYYNEYQSCYEHMQSVGDFSEIYSYDNITESLIEEVTKKIHEVRQRMKDKKISWECYANDEYNRRSTYSRTLSIRYRIKIINKFYDSDYSLLADDEEWAKYEHMRWNMHVRSLGYVVGKETKKDRRVHADLVPFEQLAEKKKSYDYIDVDEEIISLLS